MKIGGMNGDFRSERGYIYKFERVDELKKGVLNDTRKIFLLIRYRSSLYIFKRLSEISCFTCEQETE